MGSYHFSHLMSITLVNYLLELGLIQNEDLDKFLNIMYLKLGSLKGLEHACDKDAISNQISASAATAYISRIIWFNCRIFEGGETGLRECDLLDDRAKIRLRIDLKFGKFGKFIVFGLKKKAMLKFV